MQAGRPDWHGIGHLFKTIGAHMPPPAGLKSPLLWGTRDWIDSTFRAEASALHVELRHFVFRYQSPQHFLEIFRDYYGPALKAFEALDEQGRKALARDILALVGRFNRSGDNTMIWMGRVGSTKFCHIRGHADCPNLRLKATRSFPLAVAKDFLANGNRDRFRQQIHQRGQRLCRNENLQLAPIGEY